jgi:hypothetical protein
MTRTRAARSAISGWVSWRTKPFSIMKEAKVAKRPWRLAQRQVT